MKPKRKAMIVAIGMILTMLMLKIISGITWIQNRISEMTDELHELKAISDDIYTQGMTLVRQTEKPRETVWEDIERNLREAMKGSNS